MKKKIGDLADEEILNIIGDNKCKYCPYEHADYADGSSFDCPKEVRHYGGKEPKFPPCMDYSEDDVNKVIIDIFKDTNMDDEIEVEEDV